MVVADADVETAARAEHAGATVVTADDRLGKAQAHQPRLLQGHRAHRGHHRRQQHASRRAPSRRWCGTSTIPDVGAVAGEKVEADGGGEDLYWRFESWLKQREWRLGTTIGLVGELAAIRTDAWRPIPTDISTDDLWIALDLSGRGYTIAYEPDRPGLRAARAHLAPAVGAPHPQRRRRGCTCSTGAGRSSGPTVGWWRRRSGGTAWRATRCRPWPMSPCS